MAIFTAIAAAITAAVTTAFAAIGATGAIAAAVAVGVGYVGAAVIYGGVALALSSIGTKLAGGSGRAGSYGDSSATYGNPTLQTQTNQDLPIPLLYGTVKLAGNRIWQDDDGTKTVKRIVAFSDGEISDFTDIRLNDIEAATLSGIKINKYYGTPTQIVDEIVGINTASEKKGKTNDEIQEERAEKVGSLRNLAYLAISVPKGDKIDINYNLTTVVKGRKIRVYNTATNYTVKYSENPAWVMLDFLTSYNGLGLAVGNDGNINDQVINEIFDLSSFIESAAFCDEEIPYTTTDEDGKEVTKYSPRFTFNMIFDSQTSARDLLDEIYRSCRGGLFTKNGKLQFKIDKAQPVSKVFTADDITKGSETFQTIPSEEHYDILKLVYISPEHEWQKVEVMAEIPQYRDGVPIEHSVNCYSVTNFQQASRLAWYYVNSKILCPYFGSFKTDYRAYDLEVGDVIQFDSLLMGLEGYKAKVTSVVDDGTGVFTVNWRTYDERLYSDELGSKEPRVLVSNLTNLYENIEDVKNFNVTQLNEDFNMTWQYNLESDVRYEIRLGDDWDSGIEIAKNIFNNTYTWKIPSEGLYKFWIKAYNNYSYSKNATLDVCSVDSVYSLNVVVKYDIFDDLQGEYENTYYYQNAIKLEVDSELWHNTPNPWGEDLYYKNAGLWGASVKTSGVYTSQIYDVGDILDSYVSFETQYTTQDNSQNILFEWRYSEDNETWSEWEICNIGQFVFRYCQLRATFNAANGVQILLTSFKINVDVPDKEIELDVDIPDSGMLEIEYDFTRPPSIIGTVNDSIDAYIRVDRNKTNKKATIYAIKNDGTYTSAKVNLRLKGY